MPAELVRVWEWFALGHWPFGYEEGGWPSDPGRLMIL